MRYKALAGGAQFHDVRPDNISAPQVRQGIERQEVQFPVSNHDQPHLGVSTDYGAKQHRKKCFTSFGCTFP